MERQLSASKECLYPLSSSAGPSLLSGAPNVSHLLMAGISLNLCYRCLVHAQSILGYDPPPSDRTCKNHLIQFAEMDRW